jgi:hypothetical protein
MADETDLQLIQSIKAVPRLKKLPFLFLTSQSEIEVTFAWVLAGAND